MRAENRRALTGMGLFSIFALGWVIGNSTSATPEAPPPEVIVKTVTEEKVVEKEVTALPESCSAAIEAMNGFEDNIDEMDRAAGQIGLLASDVHKFAAVDDFNATVLTIEELNGQVDILDSEVIAKSEAIFEVNSQLATCQDEIS